MRIIANRRNNALLIYATPSEYAVIEGMLRKIDIIPLQVLIEATIAEVDLNDPLQYGTQFFFKADHVADTLGPLGAAFLLLGDLTFPSTLPFFTLSKSPNFALSALAAVTKVKVLSAPQVMVLDNEPARLQVGQQVPVLTGTATSTLAAGAPVVNSVDYHSTGVIMQVTPRVNSGGLVTLDIAQEVSDVAAAATNTVARLADLQRSDIPHAGGGAGRPDGRDGRSDPRQRLEWKQRHTLPQGHPDPRHAGFDPKQLAERAPSCSC